jgi:hypothetical protein
MWIHLSETQAKSAHNYGIKWSCASAPFSAGFVHILKKKAPSRCSSRSGESIRGDRYVRCIPFTNTALHDAIKTLERVRCTGLGCYQGSAERGKL